MSLNVGNIHVRTEDQRAVLRVLELPALVSSPLNGWTSIYVHDEHESSVSIEALSMDLQVPVVDFSCFESSIAMAGLTSEGVFITQMTSAYPELLEELGGSLPTEPVVARRDYNTVWLDAEIWSTVLREIAPSQLIENVTAACEEPFAETPVFAVLTELGIAIERLETKYEWVESSDSKDGFAHT